MSIKLLYFSYFGQEKLNENEKYFLATSLNTKVYIFVKTLFQVTLFQVTKMLGFF